MAQFSDASYYTTPSGAGVFSSGTSSWICGTATDCDQHGRSAKVAGILRTMTTTLLRTFAEGPAGRTHPAVDNLEALKISTATIRDRR